MTAAHPPIVPNPYPDEWDEITDFEYIDDIILKRKDKVIITQQVRKNTRKKRKSMGIVCSEYQFNYRINNKRKWATITIPACFITDGTSVPKFLELPARIIGITRWGNEIEASVIHDYLYVAWQFTNPPKTAKKKDKKFADKVFYRALRKAGISWWRAGLMYIIPLLGGWGTYKDTNPDSWCHKCLKKQNSAIEDKSEE